MSRFLRLPEVSCKAFGSPDLPETVVMKRLHGFSGFRAGALIPSDLNPKFSKLETRKPLLGTAADGKFRVKELGWAA